MKQKTLGFISHINSLDPDDILNSKTDLYGDYLFSRTRKLSEAARISGFDGVDSDVFSYRDHSRKSTHNYFNLIVDSSRANSLLDLPYMTFTDKATALNQSFHQQFEQEKIVKKLTNQGTLRETKSTLTSNFQSSEYGDPALLENYIRIREQTRFEEIDLMNDNYHFLDLRKAICRIKASFSQICKYVVANPVFEGLMILIILANTVVLAIEDPNSNNNDYAYLDTFFLYVYSAECGLKIISYGLILEKAAYFKDP